MTGAYEQVAGARLGFSAVLDIERELGALTDLLARMENGVCTLGDLAALVQMVLEAQGQQIDFLQLGEAIIKDGAALYLDAAVGLLRRVCGV